MSTIKQLKKIYKDQIAKTEYEKAVLSANSLSNLCPDDANAYNMLAHALKMSNQLEAALKCYQMSLLMDGNQVNVHLVVGEILSMQGKKSEAFGFFLKGMELNPETPEVLHKTGSFLIDAGYLEEAELLLSKALRSGCTPVIFDLLDLYEKQGDKQILQKFMLKHQAILKEETDNLSLANAYLSLHEYEKSIFYLKGMGIDNKPDNWLRAYNNLLAQAYEKKGLYSQAFEKYQQQNLKSKTVYSTKDAEALFNKSISVSNNIKVSEKMAVYGLSRSYRPVFIVGLPRSGTSLLEQILNVDDSVVVAGELNFIESAFKEYTDGRRPLADLSEWYQDKCEFIINDSGVDIHTVNWVSDKMPINFAYLGFIKEMIPEARFLYCKRNPMDTGLSIFKQNFTNSHAYANSLDNIAHFIALERGMMSHWLELYPASIYTVNYEQLVTEFDSESEKIYDFLDLDWTEKVRLFYKNTKVVNTASYNQVRNPINTKAVGAFHFYENELNPLKQKLQKYGVIDDDKAIVEVFGVARA